MSPDIEWRVGNEADGQETIVRIKPPAPPRWHKLLLLVVVLLGVGLGVTYASIPEPPNPLPTPTLQPTATVMPRPTSPPVLSASMPANSVEAAIDREALALANHAGDDTFDLKIALDDTAQAAYGEWYYALFTAGGDWGTGLYTVEQTGTLHDGLVWADVRQFRRGNFFQQTRFYRQVEEGHWQPVLPSSTFWGGHSRAINTLSLSPTLNSPLISFEMSYSPEDEALVPLVADRFSRALMYLCIELGCPIKDLPSLARGQPIALTVSIRATVPYAVRDTGNTISVTIPSPRVTGYYDKPEIQGDPIESMAFDSLLAPAARLAAGAATRRPADHHGELLLNAIIDWLRVRVSDEYAVSSTLVQPVYQGRTSSALRLNGTTARGYYQQLLAGEDLLPLETIWRWRPDDPLLSGSTRLAENEAEAFIAFLDQRFGSDSVIRFLRMLGTTDSLPLAIERTLVINYSDFMIGWEQWIGQRS